MITHHQMKMFTTCSKNDINDFVRVNSKLLADYIYQQEKKDKLLELYKRTPINKVLNYLNDEQIQELDELLGDLEEME